MGELNKFEDFAPESQEYIKEKGFLPITEEMSTATVLSKYLFLHGEILAGMVPTEVWNDTTSPIGTVAFIMQERLKKDGFEFKMYDIIKRPPEFAAA